LNFSQTIIELRTFSVKECGMEKFFWQILN